uniref:Uncharacterized protein n=1 Tax=Arundo donax TaxID=35708 RepID=A0A0A9FAB6_ARUDO
MLLFCSNTCSRWVRLAILPDRVPDKPWLGAPRPMTRFWAEQVTMAQLQGSTESWSQLLSTPCGSTRPCLMAISASTSGLRGSDEKARSGAERIRMTTATATGRGRRETAIGGVGGMMMWERGDRGREERRKRS